VSRRFKIFAPFKVAGAPICGKSLRDRKVSIAAPGREVWAPDQRANHHRDYDAADDIDHVVDRGRPVFPFQRNNPADLA